MNIVKKDFCELELEELYQILRLRGEVFVVEQDCPYLDCDNQDQTAIHLYIEEDGEVASYLRVLSKDNYASIGRVIVRAKYRKKGFSDPLIEEAIDHIFSKTDYDKIKIEAQAGLQEFYGKFGFEKTSDIYQLDNLPHCDMVLKK